MDEQNNGFEERDASLDPDPDPKSMTEEELAGKHTGRFGHERLSKVHRPT